MPTDATASADASAAATWQPFPAIFAVVVAPVIRGAHGSRETLTMLWVSRHRRRLLARLRNDSPHGNPLAPERLIAPPGKHSIVMYASPLAVQNHHHGFLIFTIIGKVLAIHISALIFEAESMKLNPRPSFDRRLA
jgi:hypothetical protein